MILVNLSQDQSKINSYLSNTLISKIEENLINKKKIILYINKRWEYSSLICKNCNYLYKCSNCDILLSVHKYPENLICHLCWNTKNIPINCEKCNSNILQKVWVWTQQIEKILKDYLIQKKINAKIFRFDTDSIKNKKDKESALKELENAEIIIGTKMITTGFDFQWIWLIWIILLEQELQIPKYNTEENVYSNIKQLIWRWERRWEQTDIIIQTFVPENEIIQTIVNNNYKDFFIKTLKERKLFNYPPFCEIITLEFRNKSQQKAKDFISNLKNKLDLELITLINKKDEQNNILNFIKINEIILNPKFQKKYNQYYYKIIIKWIGLREFIKCIKLEIMRNKGLVVIFD